MLQNNSRGHRKASHSYEVPFHPSIMIVVIHVMMVQYIMIIRRIVKTCVLVADFVVHSYNVC